MAPAEPTRRAASPPLRHHSPEAERQPSPGRPSSPSNKARHTARREDSSSAEGTSKPNQAKAAAADAASPTKEDEKPIDMETFQQILELDEDSTRDFSSEMVWQYFSQAHATFKDIDAAFEKGDLERLSSLGHFLKGSSATLGVIKVQAACEKLQHWGLLREETGAPLLRETAISRIGPLVVKTKADFAVAEEWLKKWYEDEGVTPPTGD